MLSLLNVLLLFLFIGVQTQEVKFEPHMINHRYKGCPENSYCQEKVGKRRLHWRKKLISLGLKRHKIGPEIEKFRRNYGIPIEVWTKAESYSQLKDKVIAWDSPCSNHHQKDSKIIVAEMMVKNFKEMAKQKELIFPKIWLLDGDRIIDYLIPKSDAPLALDNGKLIFTKEELGLYYALQVDPQGEVQVIPPRLPPNHPKEVKCPETLTNTFKKEVTLANLYQGHFCKAVWDIKKKRYQTMLMGWSCN